MTQDFEEETIRCIGHPYSRSCSLRSCPCFVAVQGAEHDSIDVTIDEQRVFGQRYLPPSVHSWSDIRPRDLGFTSLAQIDIAACIFENPDRIIVEYVNALQLP